MTKELFLRVFTDEAGDYGDRASVVRDEGRHIPDAQRQAMARSLATGETAFINSLETANISIVHPQGELGFAGVAALATAWLITSLRSEPAQNMYTRDGAIKTWQDGDIVWARASLDIMPKWNCQQLSSPNTVEALSLDDMKHVEHTMVWAWVDESKGLIRARTFASDWEIPEPQGNGSGAMVLAANLQRDIQIKHGKGSMIFAKPAPNNQADIGGRVVAAGDVSMQKARQLVEDVATAIVPSDDLEAQHRQDVLDWIDSGAPLYRVERPDKPPKHLVSYIVPYDEVRNRIMLVDHAKAKAWLPPGGHVDIGEDPKNTAIREAKEELGIDASFAARWGYKPLFMTVTTTKGYGEHTDVSLWYVIDCDSKSDVKYTDTDGSSAHKWLTPKEILATDIIRLDPHMHRFIKKLQLALK